jgi:hypothetical protein
VDYDASFNFYATSGDLTSHELNGLSTGMKYIWKVSYLDSGTGTFTWSYESSFKVGTSVMETIPQIYGGKDIASFRMMTFPFWCDDPSALEVFGITYDTRHFRIGRYVPDKNSGEYVEINDSEAVLNPGEALWILARDGMDITVGGIPVSVNEDIEVPLYYNTGNGNGWNQIGCPNARNYAWGDVEVIEYDTDGSIISGPTALSNLNSDNDFVDIRVWQWAGGSYDEFTPDDNFILVAYEGYWVKAKKKNIFLVFPVAAQMTSVSQKYTMLAGLFKDSKRWVKNQIRILAPATAIAEDWETPPMPMGVLTSTSGSVTSESGGGGGGCFIATAAWGTPMDRHVRILKEFRDNCLLTNKIGRLFVDIYYRYSPAAADYISKHESLRFTVKWVLLPIVAFSWIFINLGVSPMLIIMLLGLSGLIIIPNLKKKLKSE